LEEWRNGRSLDRKMRADSLAVRNAIISDVLEKWILKNRQFSIRDLKMTLQETLRNERKAPSFLDFNDCQDGDQRVEGEHPICRIDHSAVNGGELRLSSVLPADSLNFPRIESETL
jgi:hypothetical protein